MNRIAHGTAQLLLITLIPLIASPVLTTSTVPPPPFLSIMPASPTNGPNYHSFVTGPVTPDAFPFTQSNDDYAEKVKVDLNFRL
ncbi:hypothetical protein WN943_010437 [Citrus x changshan-huyou]